MRRALFTAVALAVVGCTGPREPSQDPSKGTAKAQAQPPNLDEVAVEPRSHMLPAYPCSSCHATRTPRPERYELKEFHQVRNHEFSHGEDAFWCYQCHALKDLDKLVTATGQLVSFDEASGTCTSCHGDKLDDWRTGAHGLMAGQWNGPKLRKACPACHDPHDPRYPSMKPEPPPELPRGLKAL